MPWALSPPLTLDPCLYVDVMCVCCNVVVHVVIGLNERITSCLIVDVNHFDLTTLNLVVLLSCFSLFYPFTYSVIAIIVFCE